MVRTYIKINDGNREVYLEKSDKQYGYDIYKPVPKWTTINHKCQKITSIVWNVGLDKGDQLWRKKSNKSCEVIESWDGGLYLSKVGKQGKYSFYMKTALYTWESYMSTGLP